MQIHNLIQGTPEWHAHRATHFNASDAPAMMGVSPYESRNQLLHRLHTGITKEVDAATQRRFDDGHRFEALARPIAEQIIGEDLSPVTGSSGKYSASFDGLTMDYLIGFEHKTLNEDIRGCTSVDELPEMYRVQMEQQCLVSGCQRILFMATKWHDETPIESKEFSYAPDLKLRERIIAGWEQFEKDLAAYVPKATAELPQAEISIELPALFVHAEGKITTHNMREFGDALKTKLEEVRSIVLVTDQDFANAKASAKMFREKAKEVSVSKDQMLAQTVTIGEAARMMDAWREDLNKTALQLEKDVERMDLEKKRLMISEAMMAFAAHVESLEAETRPIQLNVPRPDFATAIKGKSKYTNMQDAIDTLLSQSKQNADAIAKDIRNKLALYEANASQTPERPFGYGFLFPDLQQIITKPMDDFTLLIQSRIEAHNQKEKEKLEAERMRIEAEVKAKVMPEPAEPKPEPVTTAMPSANINKATASLHVAKPGVHQLVDTVAKAYGVPSDVALAWLAETDFEAAVAQRLGQKAA